MPSMNRDTFTSSFQFGDFNLFSCLELPVQNRIEMVKAAILVFFSHVKRITSSLSPLNIMLAVGFCYISFK